MAQHRIGTRVSLSPLAEKKYLAACKVRGGQTEFIQNAIEHYAQGIDILKKLEYLEQLLLDLKGSGITRSVTAEYVPTAVREDGPARHTENNFKQSFEARDRAEAPTARPPQHEPQPEQRKPQPNIEPTPTSAPSTRQQEDDDGGEVPPEAFNTLGAFLLEDDD